MYKYNIILANSDGNADKEIQVFNSLLAKQVDGIIFMGNHISDELRTLFKHSKTPIVLAGSVDPEDEIESVHIDYRESVQEAVSTLLSHGNEKIAFVSGPLHESVNGKYRLDGYKAALQDKNINYDSDLVFETDGSARAGEVLWPALSAVGATAAYVCNDELAVGVMNGALDSDVKVPEEFEVVASNNSKLTEMVRPQLSSVTQPMYDIGAVAMRYLTKMMNSNDEEVEEDSMTVLLPYGFVKRASTR